MARSTTVTITGMDEVLRNLSAYSERARDGAAQALVVEAETIMADSKANFVPVDTGRLQESGTVGGVEYEGDKASITLAYTAPYAGAVHENPRAGKTGGTSPTGRRYRHWATTGGWKYLETPVLNATAGMLGRLADHIRTYVGSRL